MGGGLGAYEQTGVRAGRWGWAGPNSESSDKTEPPTRDREKPTQALAGSRKPRAVGEKRDGKAWLYLYSRVRQAPPGPRSPGELAH